MPYLAEPIIEKKEVKKEKREFWGALLAIALGVVQIVVGAAITFFSTGAAVGFGVRLMIDGAKDILKGINGLISGHFDLKQYFKEKAIDLLVNIVISGPAALAEIKEMAQKGF